jgi:hypothetical protein
MTPSSLALEKISAEVVNILQGMSATKDADLGYSHSVVYFNTNSLRYTTKNYQNLTVDPVSITVRTMQIQG